MKKYTIILIALFACTGLLAQGEMDAIRLSGSSLRGTARGQAMGGAFGALGGDVTGIMINPAGLGLYRSSELNFTMALNFANTQTDWQNTINKGNNIKFNFDNISYVGYYSTGNAGLPTLNFAFSWNRLKSFNRSYIASGRGMNSSLTDYITAITNGYDGNQGVFVDDMIADSRYEGYDPYRPRYGDPQIPWLSILGWNGWLINDDTDYTYSSILFPDEKVAPRLEVNERGYIDSYDVSLGANVQDKFYWGLTFSLTDISYRWDSRYDEEFKPRGGIGLDNYLETNGTGYQVKLGAIWRPADFLRFGVSYYSPTWYYLTDYYQGRAIAQYDIKDEWAKTPDHAYTRYRFNTPYNWIFSIAGIIGTKAIVSLDYEIKDYRGMKLMDNLGRPQKIDNDYIEEDFKVASTLRAGLEFRFTPQLSGRLGYSYVQNPYEKEFKNGWKEAMIIGTIPHYTIDGDAHHFTTGIGYRFTPQFYIDAAFIYRTQQNDLYYFPSVVGDDGNFIVQSTPASMTNRACKGLVTVGYKF